MHRLVRLLVRLTRSRDASVTTEVVGVAVLLVLLLVAAADFASRASASGRLQRAATETANVATQFKQLRQGMTVQKGDEVGILFVAAREIAKPLDLDTAGAVVVTSVANQGSGARIMWQERSGVATWTSRIGSGTGGLATLPTGFALRAGESALFVEVFYGYQPHVLNGSLFGGDSSPVPMYRTAVFRPRFGALTSLDP